MLTVHDRLHKTEDIYYPFAVEERLCREAGEGRLPTPLIHLWRHERAFVLGLRDSRLPNAAAAMDWLEREEGYQVMVRNSGGAAVPLDLGVVNVTLIQTSVPGRLGMNDDFRLMAALLAETLAPFGVAFDAGEVAGSYCPGEFDLSVGGRKFCGLAQRRQLRAYAVQAFVNAEGDSRARASLVREFYRRAGGGEARARGALEVRADVMGSLIELCPSFPGAETWLQSLVEAFGGEPAPWGEADAAEARAVAAALRHRYDVR
ncbi:lipoate--protein ligase family protein [Paenibacillus sp. TRM 82003]|nr:lipoate--protein ligase family protein [Paenibacillus sp. TRM 82003]